MFLSSLHLFSYTLIQFLSHEIYNKQQTIIHGNYLLSLKPKKLLSIGKCLLYVLCRLPHQIVRENIVKIILKFLRKKKTILLKS